MQALEKKKFDDEACGEIETAHPGYLLLLIPASLLFVAFNLAHYAAAIALTIAAFFPVLVVHIGSEIAGGYKLKEEAGKLRILKDTTHGPRYLRENLEELNDYNGWTYSTISLGLEVRRDVLQPSKIHLWANNHEDKDSELLADYSEMYNIDLNRLNASDKKAIRALIELNAGG